MAIRMTAKEPLAQPVKVKPTTMRTEVHIQAVHVGRGRPASGKVMVTMRLDPDVVAKFKATGAGWQSRINDALKAAKV
jgi:uncharacterized protein (DUF4415 family)